MPEVSPLTACPPAANRQQETSMSQLISLGIGDTTEPIPAYIVDKLQKAAAGMGTLEGYSGYGAEQGRADLRAKIAEKVYGGLRKPEEVRAGWVRNRCRRAARPTK